MPRGGLRPGTGGARKGAGRPKKKAPDSAATLMQATGERPKFASAREFGLWAINAPDTEVPIDLKLRAMQVLAPLEAKQAPKDEAPAAPASGKYAPRQVRGFGVVSGGRS
jgi:hypothetical protein